MLLLLGFLKGALFPSIVLYSKQDYPVASVGRNIVFLHFPLQLETRLNSDPQTRAGNFLRLRLGTCNPAGNHPVSLLQSLQLSFKDRLLKECHLGRAVRGCT